MHDETTDPAVLKLAENVRELTELCTVFLVHQTDYDMQVEKLTELYKMLLAQKASNDKQVKKLIDRVNSTEAALAHEDAEEPPWYRDLEEEEQFKREFDEAAAKYREEKTEEHYIVPLIDHRYLLDDHRPDVRISTAKTVRGYDETVRWMDKFWPVYATLTSKELDKIVREYHIYGLGPRLVRSETEAIEQWAFRFDGSNYASGSVGKYDTALMHADGVATAKDMSRNRKNFRFRGTAKQIEEIKSFQSSLGQE